MVDLDAVGVLVVVVDFGCCGGNPLLLLGTWSMVGVEGLWWMLSAVVDVGCCGRPWAWWTLGAGGGHWQLWWTLDAGHGWLLVDTGSLVGVEC